MARTRHWSFGHQNNKRYWYVRVELRNTWYSPFKKRFVILVCTHGCCYFTAPMLPRFLHSPLLFQILLRLLFTTDFFFESFHESRTTPSKSIEVKSLSLNLFQFYTLGRSFQMCWMLLKKIFLKSKDKRIWNNSGMYIEGALQWFRKSDKVKNTFWTF